MTATSPSSAPTLFGCRPSAPLRVAHKPLRGVVALTTMLLTIAVGALAFAAAPASAAVVDQAETRVAAINSAEPTDVEAPGLLRPRSPPASVEIYDDTTLGCCVAPSGGTVDFAHGTTTAGARSIIDDGLSEAAGAASSAGGRYARPGSFHTFGVSPGNTQGMQLAYEMALRHGDDACVVICRIPTSTYDDLVRQGHVIGERIPGVSIPQTVFRPGAFPIINRTATWVGPIKPGG